MCVTLDDIEVIRTQLRSITAISSARCSNDDMPGITVSTCGWRAPPEQGLLIGDRYGFIRTDIGKRLPGRSTVIRAFMEIIAMPASRACLMHSPPRLVKSSCTAMRPASQNLLSTAAARPRLIMSGETYKAGHSLPLHIIKELYNIVVEYLFPSPRTVDLRRSTWSSEDV